MRARHLHGLALVTSLVARAMRLGPPRPVSVAERLANIPSRGLPVQAPVRIHWDAHQVPSIEASDLGDLAVGLGVVHAHLRLSQIEAMRRIATARVSEAIGRAGIELDRAVLLMDFARAVPGIDSMLPDATRRWAQGFVAGINHVVEQAPERPHEWALLGLAPRPWTVRDLLAVSRLAAADVSWMVFARLLRAQAAFDPRAWDALWPTLQEGDILPVAERPTEAAFGLVRGSNSAAVAASRSGTGAPLIASDPHLSIAQPPLWLIAGLHAPELDAVGLMLPGGPAVARGRSGAMAWGGTSLHAASSELIDVTGEPVGERFETVPVKGAAPVRLRLRQTRFGPMVSDSLLLRSSRPLALRWVGHQPSAELSALLGLMRAESLEQFRAALGGFAVPGQTMVAVEANGERRAGRVIAAHLPRRAGTRMPSLFCAPAQAWALDDLVRATEFEPVPEPLVASANDRPASASVPVGFFFATPARMRRLRALLEQQTPVSPDVMRAIQQDVLQPGSLALRDALLARYPAPAPRDAPALRALREWDGCYQAHSAGALVFEALSAALARRLIAPARLRLLSAVWSGRAMIAGIIAEAPATALRAALREASRLLRRHGCWGNVHRLRIRHPLAALPLVGRRYRLAEFGAPGSNDTLNKTGHGLVTGRHQVTFGACARHVSDLSDPDNNSFVLLGGQDGWLGSANSSDQVALWRAGAAIPVPLRPEAARGWPHETLLLG